MFFKNHPIQKNFNDYEKAIENYINNIKKHDEVASVYQIGNIGVAGISDIDIIVILNNEQKCNNNYSVFDNVSNEHKYLFMHDVFIVPKNLGTRLNLITSIFEIKHLYGERVRFDSPNDEQKIIESLILLNDVATVSISHEYEYWLCQKELDLRLILARINSLKYPIYMLYDIAEAFNISIINKNNYSEFIDSFSDFRNSFFQYNKVKAEDKTIYFLKRANELALLLMNDITLINERTPFFDNYMDKCYFEYYNKKLSLKYPCTSILINLFGYIETDGIISNSIKRNFHFEGEVIFKNNYLIMLRERILALNECMKFRQKNKINYGGLWPLGYVEKINLINRVMRKIKKVLLTF
jgi:hypothetical protein